MRVSEKMSAAFYSIGVSVRYSRQIMHCNFSVYEKVDISYALPDWGNGEVDSILSCALHF